MDPSTLAFTASCADTRVSWCRGRDRPSPQGDVRPFPWPFSERGVIQWVRCPTPPPTGMVEGSERHRGSACCRCAWTRGRAALGLAAGRAPARPTAAVAQLVSLTVRTPNGSPTDLDIADTGEPPLNWLPRVDLGRIRP